MSTHEDIIKQNQLLARAEKTLTLEKLKKRRADTRRKIELGGLVIKSGMDSYNKSIVLGPLDYMLDLITQDENFKTVFTARGERLFLDK